MTTETPITPRQLREILFHLQDQDMTVRELRAILFDVREQDKPLTLAFNMFSQLKTEQAGRVRIPDLTVTGQ